MTYIERVINDKVIYGWGRVEWMPCALDDYIEWAIGPFVREEK